MNIKEVELVTEKYCTRGDTYNICPGGKGGFGYINENKLYLTEKHTTASFVNLKKAKKALKLLVADPVFLNKRGAAISKSMKDRFSKQPHHSIGKKHSEETKKKIGLSNSKNTGVKNSQYGTCWINNGLENKKIKKETLDNWLKIGYSSGRVYVN
jgi:hypothetical protein